VWYMVCDDMVGVGWAGKGGTGRWIEGLLGFVVWSGMHECSCSAVLLIAFSSCCPPPLPLLPLSFNILLSVLFSPLSISRHKPNPFLAPYSPSQLIPQRPFTTIPNFQPRAKTHPTSSPPLPIPHQTIYALPSFFKKKRAISRSHDLSRGRSAA